MREKLRQFMIGRYGTDGLNQFLSIASLVLLLIAIISRISLFTYLGAALLIFCYYRTFSRNISKRTEENYKFYTLKDRVDHPLFEAKTKGRKAIFIAKGSVHAMAYRDHHEAYTRIVKDFVSKEE